MAYLIEFVNTSQSVTINLNGDNASLQMQTSYLGDIGFGLAPLHHITTRGAQQDGDTYVDYRLDPRILQIPLVVRPYIVGGIPRMQMLYRIRERLLRHINVGDEGYLTVAAEDTSIVAYRRIYVKVVGGMTFDADPQIPYDFRTVIQFRAANPLWIDPFPVAQVFNQATFSTNVFQNSTNTYRTFPIITINGPVTNFRITNTPTSGTVRYIEYSGTIAAGTQIIMDLSPNKKTVVDGGGVNRISNITSGSDLVNFAIERGGQSLRCTGTGLGAGTNVQVVWYPNYIGI